MPKPEPDWRDFYLYKCVATITIKVWKDDAHEIVTDKVAHSEQTVTDLELSDAQFDVRKEVERIASDRVLDFVEKETGRKHYFLKPAIQWFVWRQMHFQPWEWPEVKKKKRSINDA